jgi:hypothetical protein
MALLVSITSCKKKPTGDPAATDSGGAPTAGATATTPTASPAGSTAAGSGVATRKVEAECPKSLGGSDTGVVRTIKKECGVVPVTAAYTVDDGELILEAGAQLAFAPGTSLRIGYHQPAKWIVRGTAAEPVVLTSAGDKAAGAWLGVAVESNAPRSSITGLVLEFAGGDDRGALLVNAQDVVFKDSTIRDAKGVGLQVTDDATLAEITGNTFERAGMFAISVPPSAVAAIGANTFKDGFVQIRGGTVERSGTWKNPGSYYLVSAPIDIESSQARPTVTIAAGTELRMAGATRLRVGYHSPGALKITGSKDKPVVFKPNQDSQDNQGSEPESWLGLHVDGKGELTIEGAAFEGGGGENGVINAQAGALTIKDSVFRNNAAAITAVEGLEIKSLEGCSFENNKLAIRIHPSLLGGLGATNTYSQGQRIEVTGGAVAKDATWLLQPGAQVDVAGAIDVNQSMLTIAAGVELRFAGKGMRVGYYNTGNLRVEGSAERPVIMRGVRDQAEAWTGLEIHANADASAIESLVVADVAADAAITVHGAGRVDIKNLTVKRSKAGVTWPCGAKVTTAKIKMEGGGKPEIKPTGC